MILRFADVLCCMKYRVILDRVLIWFGRSRGIALTHHPHSAAYMRRWTRSSLVQVMACRLFGTKPLPEPMLAYWLLDYREQVSVKLKSELCHFNSRTFIWKFCHVCERVCVCVCVCVCVGGGGGASQNSNKCQSLCTLCRFAGLCDVRMQIDSNHISPRTSIHRTVSCLTTRSREVSKPRESSLDISSRSEIWQAARQHRCYNH